MYLFYYMAKSNPEMNYFFEKNPAGSVIKFSFELI